MRPSPKSSLQRITELQIDSPRSQHSSDPFAEQLRGLGPVGIAAVGVVLLAQVLAPLSGLLVLVWRWRSHTSWSQLGYVKWPRWGRGVALAVIAGAALKVFMKALVMPVVGAPATNSSYQYLSHNAGALPGMLATVVIIGGFSEETVFRGYLFERLRKFLGETTGAKALILLLTTFLFAAVHYPEQGIAGVEQALVTGLVLGAMFSLKGNLWSVMVTHVAFDVTAVMLIYWGVEASVAHLIFK
jgi:uncharacterized protein